MNDLRFGVGDILVPKQKEFPAGAIVVDGYDKKGLLRFHPLGRGGHGRMSAFDVSLFRLADEWERGAALFRRGRFRLANATESFTGWTNGEDWIGWAKPHFEFAEAKRLLGWEARQNTPEGRTDSIAGVLDLPAPGPAGEVPTEKEGFDATRDVFVTRSREGKEEVWPGEFITITDGTRMKVYAVGAGAWIWREAG